MELLLPSPSPSTSTSPPMLLLLLPLAAAAPLLFRLPARVLVAVPGDGGGVGGGGGSGDGGGVAAVVGIAVCWKVDGMLTCLAQAKADDVAAEEEGEREGRVACRLTRTLSPLPLVLAVEPTATFPENERKRSKKMLIIVLLGIFLVPHHPHQVLFSSSLSRNCLVKKNYLPCKLSKKV